MLPVVWADRVDAARSSARGRRQRRSSFIADLLEVTEPTEAERYHRGGGGGIGVTSVPLPPAPLHLPLLAGLWKNPSPCPSSPRSRPPRSGYAALPTAP